MMSGGHIYTGTYRYLISAETAATIVGGANRLQQLVNTITSYPPNDLFLAMLTIPNVTLRMVNPPDHNHPDLVYSLHGKMPAVGEVLWELQQPEESRQKLWTGA